MQFLNGPEAHREIKKLLNNAKSVRIAVPYWGRMAASRLGLDSLNAGDLRVVCNLRSGGCNPDEIEKLLQRFGKSIKTSDMLHAKLWIIDNTAILGSSNASTNGLGVEAGGSEELIELNVKLTNSNNIEYLVRWFDLKFNSGEEITKSDIVLSRKIYNKINNIYHIVGSSILDAAVNDPSQFEGKDISVWVWNPPPASKEAQEAFKAEKEARHGQDIDFYEACERLKGGQYIIDINPDEKPTSVGIYKILEDKPRINFSIGDENSYIHLCRKVDRIGDLKLGDVQRWRIAANKASETGGDAWNLSDFTIKFLR